MEHVVHGRRVRGGHCEASFNVPRVVEPDKWPLLPSLLLPHQCTQDEILSVADAMVAQGLDKLGYQCVWPAFTPPRFLLALHLVFVWLCVCV